MQLVLKVAVNAVALWVATVIVAGVDVAGDSVLTTVLTLVVVAVIFGLVNAVIKPVVKVLALPLYILTLGLITFVINALMLWLTGQIAGAIDVPFEVDSFFWAAVLGALVISVVSFLLHLVLPDGE